MRSLRLLTLALSGLLLAPACSDDTTTKPRVDFRIKPTEAGPGLDAVSDRPVIVTESGQVIVVDDTIPAINKGTIAEGATVVLKDVIVTAVDGYGQYTGDVYVQDPAGGPYSGLKLYRPQRLDGNISDLQPGDHVKVEGTVKHFSPNSPFPDNKKVIELDTGCTIAKLSGGAPPVPQELSVEDLTKEPVAASWTHVLVKVKDVAVTTPMNSYNEFKVGDGLAVDDELFLKTPAPAWGDCLTITGVAFYFYDYKLAPRAETDFEAGAGCPTVKTVTIKEIQDESSPNHPAAGSPVKVSGIITAVDTTASSSGWYNGFWIQEEAGGVYSGIYVYYSWNASATNKPVRGDLVEVRGLYSEYKPSSATTAGTVSEIQDAGFTLVRAQPPGQPTPALIANPADIATGGSRAEEYEGVLVKVENVEVAGTIENTGTPPKTVGIKLKDSNLYVDYEIYDFIGATPPAVGTKYTTITGVLHYAFDNFRLLPRDAADLVK